MTKSIAQQFHCRMTQLFDGFCTHVLAFLFTINFFTVVVLMQPDDGQGGESEQKDRATDRPTEPTRNIRRDCHIEAMRCCLHADEERFELGSIISAALIHLSHQNRVRAYSLLPQPDHELITSFPCCCDAQSIVESRSTRST